MPVMNVSELKDARTNKWAADYAGGVGFENYQIILGFTAFATVSLVLWLSGLGFVGLGFGLAAGYGAAIAPNYINTHHQHPRDYLEGLVRKRLQRTLILNDKRVANPPDEREQYVIEISEFSTLDFRREDKIYDR